MTWGISRITAIDRAEGARIGSIWGTRTSTKLTVGDMVGRMGNASPVVAAPLQSHHRH